MGLLLLGGAVLQASAPSVAWAGQPKAPLLLGVVIYYALNREFYVMQAAAFAAGLLQDGLSLIPLGYSSFWFCVFGWVVQRWRPTVLTDALVTYLFFGAAAGLAMTGCLYGVLAARGLVGCAVGWVVLKGLGTAALGMVCTPVIWAAASRLDRFVGNVEMRESPDGLLQ
jgi:cell shape-determining protein MreD